jgi:hypothetical protein
MPKAAEAKKMKSASLLCRRILLCNHIPICPYLDVIRWSRDPRLIRESDWWVDSYLFPIMQTCDIFCYTPELAGEFSQSLHHQKNLWRSLGKKHSVVSTDTIIATLLHQTAKEVLS